MKGFTLIELIVYFAIAITLSTVMVTAGLHAIAEKTRLMELDTVERSARGALEIITREIRGAQTVVSPQAGATSTILILTTATGTASATFSLNNGYLQLQKETLTPLRITNAGTAVTATEFTNLSSPNTAGTVRISFTLVNGATRKNFYATQNIYVR